ncbi:MAG: hypothetical protein LBV72_10270 [Tannerella sp.]|jgi:hypothetical protein|nr:hypothetical protein [Tannerella sp.]
MKHLSLGKLFSSKYLATFYLILMCVQIVFIEGYAISPVKVAAMALAPFICIIKVPYLTRALIVGLIYLFIIFFCAMTKLYVRFSTIGYLAMFVFTFIFFYNLIYTGAFTIDYFIKLLRYLILGYFICLVLQQLSILVGIRYFPIINLTNQFFLSIAKLPSLSIEPSHTARILCVSFYIYLKCNEFKNGAAIPFKQLLKGEHKWVTIGFLWVMLTMGSGTAFIGLIILSLYFIRKEYLVYIVPLFIILYISMPYMGLTQLDRAINVLSATMERDNEVIAKADGSASVRIIPILNTINNLDLTKSETWFGYGTDYGVQNKAERMIAEITDYGLFAYIGGLILVFSCSIRFWSLGTLMYFTGIGGGTANIAYQWGILMLFICMRYFYDNRWINRQKDVSG